MYRKGGIGDLKIPIKGLSLQSVFGKNHFIYRQMYAIVDIAGKQFKVTQDQYVYVPKQGSDIGASVEFDNVLLVDNDGDVKVGAPTVKGAKVTAEVLDHVKGDKVIVFKKKRRKGFKKKNGHRQEFTKVLIKDIK